MDKKILMVVANNGFQDYEYEKPRTALEKAGCVVDVASSQVGECVGKFGSLVVADKNIAEVNGQDYDAVVFVGGPGASKEFFENEDYLRLAQEARLVGAICIAPMIISASGVFKGKRMTGWNNEQNEQREYIEQNGVVFVDEPVVLEGNLITANGPDSAEEFGQTLVHELMS